VIKASDLRELTVEELCQKALDGQENLFNLRMQNSLTQIENPNKIRQARREIAIIKTVIREKELFDSKKVSQEKGV
jgi:large subunit ribosomal protein L29